MENFDVSSLQEEALRNIEADSFWCMSKLLDGIQVSERREDAAALEQTPNAHVCFHVPDVFSGIWSVYASLQPSNRLNR